MRYAIRVIFPNGDVAFLRHGPVIGSGPIVRFPNKRSAEDQLAFVRAGLDEGVIANLMRILPSPKRKPATKAGAVDPHVGGKSD